MFNFLRRKPKEEGKALHSINSGAWSRVLEPFSGAWQQNIEIRLDSVLAYPAIFSCISLISSDIAKMPIAVKRRQSNGIWVETNNPALTPLLIKPNFYQTAMQFLELWMISKLAHGNAYILKLRDAGDRVRQLRVLDPRRVIPYIADDGEIFYSVLTDELNGLSGGLFVPARELIHDRFNTLFHPLCGLSPVYASGLAAIGGEAMLRNSAHTFKNGGKPGGIIVVPGSVDADKAKEIKDNWNSGYSGENAGKTALLADGASFVAVSQTATDSQLVEQLNLSNQLVASTFRVPLYKIDTGQAPSYNNIEALEQAYYSQCLQVHMTAIETLLADTFDLDQQTCVEFDHSSLLRMDTATRYKTYGDGIGSGFLAPNEARIKENMKPVEGGDTPYLQQQNYSLSALAKRDAQDNPFGSAAPAAPAANTDDDDTPSDPNDPNQPPSDDESREFASLLDEPDQFTGFRMITERERGFAEIIRKSLSEKIEEARKEMRTELDAIVMEKDALIQGQLEIIKIDEEKEKYLEEAMEDQNALLATLQNQIAELEKREVDESAIAAMVYAQIEQPEVVIPDVSSLVAKAVSEIKIPQPEPLPDVQDMVSRAFEAQHVETLSADEIKTLISDAANAIIIPQPEPVKLPDFSKMVEEAVAKISFPEPEPLPDVKGMIETAIGAIQFPEPEPLPNVAKMIADAISSLKFPEPEPLPDIHWMIKEAISEIQIPVPPQLSDIDSMVKKAVASISLPEPEPLPDIQQMIADAVSLIEIPQPEPLPDVVRMVQAAVNDIEIPQPESLPDIEEMVRSAVSAIELPEPAPLPDVAQIVRDAVNQIQIPEPEPLPDIDSMVRAAIAEIEVPAPEPLPDIVQLVREAVSQIQIPEPEPLPDIEGMIRAAVAEIHIPEPEPLPDIGQLISDIVAEAVSAIELPKPEPLPDIDKMISEAFNNLVLPVGIDHDEVKAMVDAAFKMVELPKPQPLPDIKQMVSEAVEAIEIPQPREPEPLPDIYALVERAVSEFPIPEPEPVVLPEFPDFEALVSDAVTKAVQAIELPEPGKGEDGKDGLQIEVMPEIDTAKSYPRGTYALHNGGLWRAYQKTAGLSGFECVVNGLNDINIEQSDDRHFTFTLSTSNGKTEEKRFTLPVMIYRDIYQPGRKYFAGDCVTFGGSVWHCYQDTTDRPNEAGSNGWRLAVKRGRDGRSRE